MNGRKLISIVLFLLVLGLAACSSDGRIRVYVEPSYEQPELNQLLSRNNEFFVLLEPETADIRLSVSALPESQERPGERHALIRARNVQDGREVFAVARLAPRNHENIPWVNNYESGVHESSLPEILSEVVLAARAGRAPEGDTWAEHISRNPNINLP